MNPLVLHPYYKPAYIKIAWGGPEEQADEIAAGNIDTKDWQNEAKQIVENTVGCSMSLIHFSNKIRYRWHSTIETAHTYLMPLQRRLALLCTFQSPG